MVTDTQQDRSGRISASKATIAAVCFTIAAAGVLVAVVTSELEAGVVLAFLFGSLGAALLCKSAM